MLTLFKGARIVDADRDIPYGWLLTDGPFIKDFGEGNFPGAEEGIGTVVDAQGKLLMPGVVDEHVHFREPGMEHKADIASESMAAAAGGVTTFFDMPNTRPATTTLEAWADKMRRAAEKSAVNYAFYIGATPDNLDELSKADFTKIPGIKLFMGATTGTDATDSDAFLHRLFSEAPATIAVHAEDDAIVNEAVSKVRNAGEHAVYRHADCRPHAACIEATRKIIRLAHTFGRRLHVMHLSTAAELEFFHAGPVGQKAVTCETCPQYLFFDRISYLSRGERIKCNPSIKDPADKAALITAVFSGLIDTVATDHAPHTRLEKLGQGLDAPSGMPGVQYSLVLMLELARIYGKPLSMVSRLLSGNPATIWHIRERGFIRKGFYADLVLVDPSRATLITDATTAGKCGWTPYHGISTGFAVHSTWVNGVEVFNGSGITGARAAMPVNFLH